MFRKLSTLIGRVSRKFIRRKLPERIKKKIDASPTGSVGWSFTFPKDPPPASSG